MIRTYISNNDQEEKVVEACLGEFHKAELLKMTKEEAIAILEGAINIAFHKGVVEGLRMSIGERKDSDKSEPKNLKIVWRCDHCGYLVEGLPCEHCEHDSATAISDPRLTIKKEGHNGTIF